jgi:hypothetical protein
VSDPREIGALDDGTVEALDRLQVLLDAYERFYRDVGGLMLGLLERGEPAGLTLLELVRDFNARTGEHYVEGE